MSWLLKDRRGQASVELLFVFPLLFMLFTFIMEIGFLMHDWAAINYYTSSAAVKAAMVGRFNSDIRNSLANNIRDWTVDGAQYAYNIYGNWPPVLTADDTAYVYGTDDTLEIQRGDYINVTVDVPWRFRFFLINRFREIFVDDSGIRLRVHASFPSEVFFE